LETAVQEALIKLIALSTDKDRDTSIAVMSSFQSIVSTIFCSISRR